jgi:uncharacterized protein involved in oxidation of intracellular sulfur
MRSGREIQCAKDDRSVQEKNRCFAGGTCLKIRDKEESGLCPASTMDDMLNLVVESDRVLAFG